MLTAEQNAVAAWKAVCQLFHKAEAGKLDTNDFFNHLGDLIVIHGDPTKAAPQGVLRFAPDRPRRPSIVAPLPPQPRLTGGAEPGTLPPIYTDGAYPLPPLEQ